MVQCRAGAKCYPTDKVGILQRVSIDRIGRIEKKMIDIDCVD